jgi:hypothetical protein
MRFALVSLGGNSTDHAAEERQLRQCRLAEK